MLSANLFQYGCSDFSTDTQSNSDSQKEITPSIIKIDGVIILRGPSRA